MDLAKEMAWSRNIRRMWVHTCTYDHPGAVRFYTKAGFKPYAYRIEIQADPRLSGHFPMNSAAQVPIIE